MYDKITHPKHYTQGIECWDYICSHKMGYLEGNIIKYVTRYKDKDGLDDLFKAKAYLQRLIEEQFGPAVIEEPCPMRDVAPCGLDGRNCKSECSYGHPERGICSDIIGNSWTPEVQQEIEAENLAADEQHALDIVEILNQYYVSGDGPAPAFRSGSRENNTLGDYKRGGPATSGWMTRPCRYDPNE